MNVVVSDVARIGVLIRDERRRQQVTQQTLADLSAVSVHFLSNLENGKETSELRSTLRVLHALGIAIILQTRASDTV